MTIQQIAGHPVIVNFSPFLFSAAMFIVAVLALFTAARFVNKLWVAITIPSVLALVATSVITIHGMTSQPTHRLPHGVVDYVGYNISSDNKHIFYWIKVQPDSNPITVITPYTKENHENAAERSQRKARGEPVKMRVDIGDIPTDFDDNLLNVEHDNPLKPYTD